MNKNKNTCSISFIINLCIELPNTNQESFIKSNFINQFKQIVSYPIKEDRYENDIYYRLVIEASENIFLVKLNETTNILIENHEFLCDVGIEEISEFEIYIVYNERMGCIIPCEQLKKLKRLQPSNVGISTNSRCSDEKNNYLDSSEYTQLIFDDVGTNAQKIIRLWQKEALNEYEGCKYWSKIPARNQLILNVEDNLDFFKKDKIYNDLELFIKNSKDYLEDNFIKVSFGVYHQNYDGGEIGSTIIEKCIELKIDLIITKSQYKP